MKEKNRSDPRGVPSRELKRRQRPYYCAVGLPPSTIHTMKRQLSLQYIQQLIIDTRHYNPVSRRHDVHQIAVAAIIVHLPRCQLIFVAWERGHRCRLDSRLSVSFPWGLAFLKKNTWTTEKLYR